MSANASPKLPFDSGFSINDVVFNTNSAASMSDQGLAAMTDAFNSVGFFILACAPRPEPRENLLALAPLLGHVVPHNRSDRYGVLAVNPDNKVPGFIDSSNEAHLPHTDGSFKDVPEKVIALQCVVPASTGGTSLLGSGKFAHDQLAASDPASLAPLYDDDAITIQRNEQVSTKPLFSRRGDRLALCYRADQTATTTTKPSARHGFAKLKAIIDTNLLRFDLKPHQILVIDNSAIVHGRDAFPANVERSYHRLNFDGDGLLDMVFGFIPHRKLTKDMSAAKQDDAVMA